MKKLEQERFCCHLIFRCVLLLLLLLCAFRGSCVAAAAAAAITEGARATISLQMWAENTAFKCKRPYLNWMTCLGNSISV